MRDPANRESLQKGRRHDGIEQSDRAPDIVPLLRPGPRRRAQTAEIDMEGFNQVIQVMAEAGEVKSLLPAAENSSTSSICALRR